MTFYIIEIIHGIVSTILMTYNAWNHLLWGMSGEREQAVKNVHNHIFILWQIKD